MLECMVNIYLHNKQETTAKLGIRLPEKGEYSKCHTS